MITFSLVIEVGFDMIILRGLTSTWQTRMPRQPACSCHPNPTFPIQVSLSIILQNMFVRA
jgi:hypothetical protein